MLAVIPEFFSHMESYMNTFTALFTKAGDVRRAGSAALDLAYVAAGRMDGFWEIGLNANINQLFNLECIVI